MKKTPWMCVSEIPQLVVGAGWVVGVVLRFCASPAPLLTSFSFRFLVLTIEINFELLVFVSCFLASPDALEVMLSLPY